MRDKKKACEYVRMAADRGLAKAQYVLGVWFSTGDGVTLDHVEAARLYKLAAEHGFTEAEHNLGVAYVEGRGVARDVAEARRLFKRAVGKGHAPAAIRLEQLCLKEWAADSAHMFHRKASLEIARAAARDEDAKAALARLRPYLAAVRTRRGAAS